MGLGLGSLNQRASVAMPPTLIITNDFPPWVGGIESFVSDVCELLDYDVVVYASGAAGAAASDRERPFPVIRDGPLLLPTPRVATRAADLLRAVGATRVIFGAAAPLGLLGPALRRAGARRIVGLTHGHEIWWAQLPAARQLLRRIGDSCDHLTTISGYTERRIARALSPSARRRLLRLAPPVDTERFRPPQAAALRNAARCIAVARLIPQKGLTTLLRAWRIVIDRAPPESRGAGADHRRGWSAAGAAGTDRPRAGVIRLHTDHRSLAAHWCDCTAAAGVCLCITSSHSVGRTQSGRAWLGRTRGGGLRAARHCRSLRRRARDCPGCRHRVPGPVR